MKVLIVLAALIVCASCFDLKAPLLNKDIIEQINNDPTSTWKAAAQPKWEGKTLGEFVRLLGAKMSDDTHSNRYTAPPATAISEALPENFDSRQQWPDCIGPILDQGHCGSCWAFGAVEALSDRFCIHNKQKLALAAQDLVSCDDGWSQGCDGGYLEDAWEYMQHSGVVTEECYPYQMGTCTHPGCSDWPTPKCNTTCANSADWKKDKHFGKNYYSVAKKADTIATEIMNNGPVEAAFTVYEDFAHYKSGIYQHKTGSALGGHAIKIIGWGVENGTSYWLVANSWNTSWGEQGLFRIKKGNNECGIEGNIVAGLPKQ